MAGLMASTLRVGTAELELEVKGYSPAMARAAVKRAVRQSQAVAERMPAELQDVVFAHHLEWELRRTEPYLDGMLSARARGDYERGMQRAMRDDRFEEGVERSTGAVVGEAATTWRRELPAAVKGWSEW